MLLPSSLRKPLFTGSSMATRPAPAQHHHAHRHLHRRPARARATTCAAHVLRLRRQRLVDREHVPRERSRLREDQAAPAGGGQHGEPHAAHAHDRRGRRDAGRARAHRPHRHAARRRRDPRGTRGRGLRRAVHVVDDEHLLDRRRRRAHAQAVLVPALCDARSRFHRAADRPRESRQLLGAGADARPAGARTAPQGRAQRAVGAAEAHAAEHPEHDDQAGVVPEHAAHAAPPVRQHRRPREGCRRHGLAQRMDRAAVRPAAELGRCRVDQEALGRQAGAQGHHRCRRRQDWRPTRAPTR